MLIYISKVGAFVLQVISLRSWVVPISFVFKIYVLSCGYRGTNSLCDEKWNYEFCHAVLHVHILTRATPACNEGLMWNSEQFWCHYCNPQRLQHQYPRASSITMSVYSLKSANSFLFTSKTIRIIQQTRSLAPSYSPCTTFPMKYVPGGWLHPSHIIIVSGPMPYAYMYIHSLWYVALF